LKFLLKALVRTSVKSELSKEAGRKDLRFFSLFFFLGLFISVPARGGPLNFHFQVGQNMQWPELCYSALSCLAFARFGRFFA
jgi:hypothetical protein